MLNVDINCHILNDMTKQYDRYAIEMLQRIHTFSKAIRLAKAFLQEGKLTNETGKISKLDLMAGLMLLCHEAEGTPAQNGNQSLDESTNNTQDEPPNPSILNKIQYWA